MPTILVYFPNYKNNIDKHNIAKPVESQSQNQNWNKIKKVVV